MPQTPLRRKRRGGCEKAVLSLSMALLLSLIGLVAVLMSGAAMAAGTTIIYAGFRDQPGVMQLMALAWTVWFSLLLAVLG